MEVEQTLQVLDGAIVVMDSSAGVEAQTLTVWRQADRYHIPRIIFLNKMDRNDANVDLCMESIKSKLGNIGVPLLLQLPLRDGSGGLIGVVDLLTMEKIVWNKKSSLGKEYVLEKLNENEGDLWKRALKARNGLVEKIADLDDVIAEEIISNESVESVTSKALELSLRSATLSQKGVPVLCGSAYHNKGVQPLMDAVVKYLPSPLNHSNTSVWNSFGDNLLAKAFKIMHHPQKGPLTFVRLYSGMLKKGQRVFNLRLQKYEPSTRLMVAYADDYEDIEEISSGNIAVISGLRETVTGDMLANSGSAASSAKSYLMKVTGWDEKRVDAELYSGAVVPDPVFFCSIEPESQAFQNELDKALNEVAREDPSLRVMYNNETNQTVLGGMGELHLDIIKERITSEYKIDVDLGPLQIAYKEKLGHEVKDSFTFTHRIGTSTHEVKLTISLSPGGVIASHSEGKKDDLKSTTVALILDRSPDSAANICAITPKQLQSIRRGVEFALCHGPRLSCPVVDLNVTVHWFEVKRGTSETIVVSSVTQAVHWLLKSGGIKLMEPIMELEIVLNSEDKLQMLLTDLSYRRPLQQEVEPRGSQVVIHALVPLSELLGYSTDLRTLSSGTASFAMAFSCYREMSVTDEVTAVKHVLGFDSQ